jgi:tRNA dimethylallyltransferase
LAGSTARRSGPSRSVIALFGPTASGKTAVAEALADRVDGDVVSADSMQAYCGLPILTAQPERPTRLVGIWPLSHEGSVGEYAALAHAAIDEVLASGRTPIVTGGTGLYLRAALVDLGLPPAPREGRRGHWERLYDRIGPEAAHRLLVERDAAAARAVHAHDRRRVVRALELAEAGESLAPSKARLWSEEMRHPTIVFGLDVPPDVLARRIELRARSMFDAGVVDEVRAAISGRVIGPARKIVSRIACSLSSRSRLGRGLCPSSGCISATEPRPTPARLSGEGARPPGRAPARRSSRGRRPPRGSDRPATTACGACRS